MGKKSAPPAPDYTGAANAQAEASKENLTQQTWANRANQTNPWGSTTWSASPTTDPATGKTVTQWSENTTLDPKLQGALDSQLAMQQGRSDLAGSLLPRAAQEFSQPMDWSNAVGWAGAPQTPQGGSPTTSAYGFGGPRQQRIDTSRQGTPTLNANMGANAGDIQGGLNFGGVQGVDKATDTRARAEDAIYKSATSRLDPQWQQRQSSLETDLANRGISQNSEAYTRAMRDFDTGRNDAYSQAQMAAITGGGAEAQRDFGMDLGLRQQQVGEIGQAGNFANAAQAQGFGQDLNAGQANNAAQGQAFGFGQQARQTQLGAQGQAFNQQLSGGNYDLQRQQQAFSQQQQAGGQNFNQQLQAAQFQNQTRQNQLSELMQQRGFSLNEINALISGQQVSAPQFQGYNPAGVAQAPDLLGAANLQYQGGIDALNARNAGSGQLMNAAAMAGAAYMMSDRRVKKDIRRVGTHRRGIGLYTYRFVGERGPVRLGVMAQEVRRVAPCLVREFDGVLRVDYAGIYSD
jgi:hypothetical protein